jgi:excisionase family DNA binding protein
MENDLITKDSEIVKSFFFSLEQMLDGIESLVENCKPSLNGERYLTDKEVSERLKVSRRTLQDYRTEGKIPYYQLGGGKILYKESDIEKMLDDNYFPTFE